MKVYLVTLCDEGHEHRTELLHATVKDDDGTWSGYAGSAADFCQTCDGPCEVVGVMVQTPEAPSS